MSSGFEIWHHFPLFCRQWLLTTTTNEIMTTSKRLETASHGMETSKKWGLRSPTKSERNHNELLCCHKIFNILKICRRTRRIISAVCDRNRIRQQQLTATHNGGNSKLQFVAKRTLPYPLPIRHSLSQALLLPIMPMTLKPKRVLMSWGPSRHSACPVQIWVPPGKIPRIPSANKFSSVEKKICIIRQACRRIIVMICFFKGTSVFS